MREIITMNNELFGDVRFINLNGKPYAVASDVAKMLGYAKPSNAINQHCRGTLKQGILDITGFEQQMNIIPESDIYRLIIKSKLPEAEKFEKWVMEEVLPQIRQTGGYIPINDEMSDDEIMAKALLVAQRTIDKKDKLLKEKEAQLLVQAPKVEFHDTVTQNETEFDASELAKTLNFKRIGRNNLIALLKEKKVLDSDKEMYQTYIDRGYGRVVETDKLDWYGHPYRKTVYTTKGMMWVKKKLLEWGYEEKN